MKKYFYLMLGSAVLYSCSSTKQNSTKLESDLKINITPTSVYVGDSAKVSWSVPAEVKNAKISINEMGDNLSNTGTKSVGSNTSKDYTISVEKKGKTYSKTARLEVKERPFIENFSANPAVISAGDSTELSWSVKNLSAERVIIDGLSNVGNSGKSKLKLEKDTSFNLKIVGAENKVLGERKVSIKVNDDFPPKGLTSNSKINVKTPAGAKISVSEGPDDGRYSLGGNGKRLMYGWPVPQSTSHFVIKVNDNYGTNYNRLSANNVYYISSKQFTKGEKGSVYNEIVYMVDGVKVIQRLIPVDKNFKPVKMNTFGQYYKIEYEIVNTTQESKKVGLISLTDLMMDDNDGPVLEVKGKKIENVSKYTKNDIPDEMLVYQVSGNKNEHTGKFVFNQESVKPDFLFLGRWPYFNSVVWDVNSESGAFGDNAALLKWSDEQLKPGATRSMSFYYGLLNDAQISMVSSINNLKANRITVYFKSGSTSVSNESKKTIDEELNRISGTIKGALVAGFADARGATNSNIKISKNRINETVRYLDGKKGIQKGQLIPKAYGESAADQSETSKRKGNDSDRKCEIIIFSSTN